MKCSKDTKCSALLSQLDCYPSLSFVSFSCPETVVTGAELLLGLDAGEEMLVVRDISEVSRRGSSAGCQQCVAAAPLPGSICSRQQERYSPVGQEE